MLNTAYVYLYQNPLAEVTVPVMSHGSSDQLIAIPVTLTPPTNSPLHYSLFLNSQASQLSVCNAKITRVGSNYLCAPQVLSQTTNADGTQLQFLLHSIYNNGKR